MSMLSELTQHHCLALTANLICFPSIHFRYSTVSKTKATSFPNLLTCLPIFNRTVFNISVSLYILSIFTAFYIPITQKTLPPADESYNDSIYNTSLATWPLNTEHNTLSLVPTPLIHIMFSKSRVALNVPCPSSIAADYAIIVSIRIISCSLRCISNSKPLSHSRKVLIYFQRHLQTHRFQL